jgi:hypothetical protein
MTERTTLTLEDDVAARIRDEARRQDRPLKDVINDLLRAGLETRRSPGVEPYEVPSRDMGVRPGVDLDDIQGLLDRLDGPARS